MTSVRPRGALAAALPLLLAACGGSAGGSADAGAARHDGAVPDASRRGPIAAVYRVSPTADKGKLERVTLRHITDKTGKLTGKYANAWNCLNAKDGQAIDYRLGSFRLTGRVCKPAKTVKPGKDGTYLHVKPARESDPDDAFAELMMYHHVTTIHDYFKDKLGAKGIDRSLRALANVQVYIDLLSRWFGMVNAAFIPKSTSGLLKSLGVNITNGEDALVFFQGTTVDTAYDATVILHEYTHSVIGLVLTGNAYDKYGLDPTPGALNEALADYFAASYLGQPVVGAHALSGLGGQRDLRRDLRCPGHMVGEVHRDGEIAGGALWAGRGILGQAVADRAYLNAIQRFPQSTGFSNAAKVILAEVKKLAPSKVAPLERLFRERGLLDCVRLAPHRDYRGGGLPPRIAGTATAPALFSAGAPAYVQHLVTVAKGTRQVTLTYRVSAGGGLIPGLPGGGGSSPDVAVALRAGKAPITWTYTSGTARSDAHALLVGKASGNARVLKVAGQCIRQGGLVYQLVNRSSSPGTIGLLEVKQSATVDADAVKLDRCP